MGGISDNDDAVVAHILEELDGAMGDVPVKKNDPDTSSCLLFRQLVENNKPLVCDASICPPIGGMAYSKDAASANVSKDGEIIHVAPETLFQVQ